MTKITQLNLDDPQFLIEDEEILFFNLIDKSTGKPVTLKIPEDYDYSEEVLKKHLKCVSNKAIKSAKRIKEIFGEANS